MRFKYFFYFSVFSILFFLAPINAFSQEEQSAELEVRLYPVLTFTLLDVNPTLIFDEADDFINGVTYTAPDAAKVTASAPFSITVKADKNHLRDSANNKIKTKSVYLEASGTDIGSTSKVALSPAKREFISGAPAGIEKNIGFTYSTVGNDSEFIGKPAGDYTVELTFTATLD